MPCLVDIPVRHSSSGEEWRWSWRWGTMENGGRRGYGRNILYEIRIRINKLINKKEVAAKA